ncbi:hypothetical protein FKO01_05020 [Mesorhizobium sp. B2-3-3]|nr:hypothetical protein FKO01_05020 [Mesorhizobium sp. B2-3-3]
MSRDLVAATGTRMVEDSDDRSPYQIAKSELAAFKFKLVETVAADPLLSKAPCTDAIVVLSSFVTIDKRTLKPTPAYASTITLMARGGMKETAAKRARKLLETGKYIVPTGSRTKDGCIKYRLENPHEERVRLHVNEATEYWKEKAAEERKEERRKKAKANVGSEYDPTEIERGVGIQPDVGSEYDPNYLRTNLSDLGYEEEATPLKVSTASSDGDAAGSDDDRHIPFPVPSSADELAATMSTLFADFTLGPLTISRMRTLLATGRLTRAIVEGQRSIAA